MPPIPSSSIEELQKKRDEIVKKFRAFTRDTAKKKIKNSANVLSTDQIEQILHFLKGVEEKLKWKTGESDEVELPRKEVVAKLPTHIAFYDQYYDAYSESKLHFDELNDVFNECCSILKNETETLKAMHKKELQEMEAKHKKDKTKLTQNFDMQLNKSEQRRKNGAKNFETEKENLKEQIENLKKKLSDQKEKEKEKEHAKQLEQTSNKQNALEREKERLLLIESHDKNICAKDDEIANLQTEIEQIKQELTGMQSEVEQSKTKQQTHEELHKQFRTLQDESEKLRQKNSELLRKLQDASIEEITEESKKEGSKLMVLKRNANNWVAFCKIFDVFDEQGRIIDMQKFKELCTQGLWDIKEHELELLQRKIVTYELNLQAVQKQIQTQEGELYSLRQQLISANNNNTRLQLLLNEKIYMRQQPQQGLRQRQPQPPSTSGSWQDVHAGGAHNNFPRGPFKSYR